MSIYTTYFMIYAIGAILFILFAKNKKQVAIINLVFSLLLSGSLFITAPKLFNLTIQDVYPIALIGIIFCIRDIVAIVKPEGNLTAVCIILTSLSIYPMYLLCRNNLWHMFYMVLIFLDILTYDVSNIKDMPVMMAGNSLFAMIMLLIFKEWWALLGAGIVMILSMIGYFKYYKLSALGDMAEMSKQRQKKKIEKQLKKQVANK